MCGQDPVQRVFFILSFFKCFWSKIHLSTLGSSAVDVATLPLMGYLMDIRYKGHHGNIYALWSVSYALAFFVGPAVGGPLIDAGNRG